MLNLESDHFEKKRDNVKKKLVSLLNCSQIEGILCL